MKLAKRILISVISGLCIFNCGCLANAARTKRKVSGVKITVTHPKSTERNMVIVDSATLVSGFKMILDMARETLGGVANNTVHDSEYRQLPRREINRIFSRIYKEIFEPALNFWFDDYDTEGCALKRKNFVPYFLVYSDGTGHRYDTKRFDDFNRGIRPKLRRNGNICKAIDEYAGVFPTFFSTSQKVLDSSIERLKELNDMISSEDSLQKISDFEACQSDPSDNFSGEIVAHAEDADEEQEQEYPVFVPVEDEAPSPSPATEPGNCLTRFFKSMFSR